MYEVRAYSVTDLKTSPKYSFELMLLLLLLLLLLLFFFKRISSQFIVNNFRLKIAVLNSNTH